MYSELTATTAVDAPMLQAEVKITNAEEWRWACREQGTSRAGVCSLCHRRFASRHARHELAAFAVCCLR
ncbi:hypothetical protein PsYK624_145200 [Phanerochaete sordida]|uniref:Uncharacterized protein n=1 Tax=Phanerochaete sordida TaxID=48140 RepID=A0A9P3GQ45_9APHY|nr:hypothetical protein PsYK624_145200 [Phanerochaete sordida]